MCENTIDSHFLFIKLHNDNCLQIIEKKRNKGTKTEKLKVFLHRETF